VGRRAPPAGRRIQHEMCYTLLNPHTDENNSLSNGPLNSYISVH
jgi:hypothetical protein